MERDQIKVIWYSKICLSIVCRHGLAVHFNRILLILVTYDIILELIRNGYWLVSIEIQNFSGSIFILNNQSDTNNKKYFQLLGDQISLILVLMGSFLLPRNHRQLDNRSRSSKSFRSSYSFVGLQSSAQVLKIYQNLTVCQLNIEEISKDKCDLLSTMALRKPVDVFVLLLLRKNKYYSVIVCL